MNVFTIHGEEKLQFMNVIIYGSFYLQFMKESIQLKKRFTYLPKLLKQNCP